MRAGSDPGSRMPHGHLSLPGTRNEQARTTRAYEDGGAALCKQTTHQTRKASAQRPPQNFGALRLKQATNKLEMSEPVDDEPAVVLNGAEVAPEAAPEAEPGAAPAAAPDAVPAAAPDAAPAAAPERQGGRPTAHATRAYTPETHASDSETHETVPNIQTRCARTNTQVRVPISCSPGLALER